VKGSGASVAEAGCEFVRSAAWTAPTEEAKTAQVEMQALNKLVGVLEAATTAFPIRIGTDFTPKNDNYARRRFAASLK
jgi:hypothetical protein